MENQNDQSMDSPPTTEQVVEDLFNFAIERDDVKYLLSQLPGEAEVKPVTVEYELQLLKIISVGWSLAFHLENSPAKEPLLEAFWHSIQEFAESLSETTGLMIGQEIDYFQVLKERLDHYVAVMGNAPQSTEPVQVIGPEFAQLCGNRQDLFAQMAGAKMFNGAVNRIKQYLRAVHLLL
jgi:hypothetical protein